MKRIKMFLTSLAVCTLAASCSKDDNGMSGPQEVDAYLSFAATTDVMTKASTDQPNDPNKEGTNLENKIQSLTAYVFDKDKKFVIHKHVAFAVGNKTGIGEESEDFDIEGSVGTPSTEGGESTSDTRSITSIRGIHVKVEKPASGTTSTTPFTVVLLANMDTFQVSSLDKLKERTTLSITEYNKGAVGASYLPMHSAELSVTNLTYSTTGHTMNWYKGGSSWETTQGTVGTDGEIEHGSETIPTEAKPVEMSRSIARVQFTSLSAQFSALQYTNLKFEIDSIYLANVRATATVTGEEKKDTTYYRGGPNEFREIKKLIKKGSVDGNLVEKYDAKALLNGAELKVKDLHFDKYINANRPKGAVEGEENYLTRLIITGTLKENGSGRVLGKKYFHIPLKLSDNVGNVTSNTFFKVKATITGEGSPDPDEILENACINFTITVEPWNVIVQTEDDTN